MFNELSAEVSNSLAGTFSIYDDSTFGWIDFEIFLKMNNEEWKSIFEIKIHVDQVNCWIENIVDLKFKQKNISMISNKIRGE